MGIAATMISDWRRFPISETLVDARVQEESILTTWSDGRLSPFHFLWLRDNCPCDRCVHRLTREQVFEIVDAPADLAAVSAQPDEAGGLRIRWSDGHESRFDAGWLRANAYDNVSRAERRSRPPKRFWRAEQTEALPVFSFAALAADDGALLDWLRALRDVGLTLVKDVPLESEAVTRLARRISFVRETSFGVVFDVASKPNPDSNAYTSINLPPHTDLPTREVQPGLQFLHCLANEASGGDSIFVDGFAIAATLRGRFPEDFEILATTPVAFWNKDTVTDYRHSAPIIATDASGDVTEIRYSNSVRGPFDAPADLMPGLYRAYRRFMQLGREAQFRIVRRLEPGDMWGFDNRRVLHARTEFDPNSGKRHLQGCYVDRDELLSRIRVLERDA